MNNNYKIQKIIELLDTLDEELYDDAYYGMEWVFDEIREILDSLTEN